MNEAEKKRMWKLAFILWWKYDYWTLEEALAWSLKAGRITV